MNRLSFFVIAGRVKLLKNYLERYSEEERKNKKWMKSYLTNTFYKLGLLIMFASCIMSIALFTVTSIALNEVRNFVVQFTLLLFTFSVALHAHELRALRMERTGLLGAVSQLEFKRLESQIVFQEDSSLQVEMERDLEDNWFRLSGYLTKNAMARNVLYPVASLCILNYTFAITFSLLASLISSDYSSWLDVLAIGFLASGFSTLVIGFVAIIRRE